MKFYIPHADTPQASERVYQTLKIMAETEAGHISDRRIFSIEFIHKEDEYMAKVGKNIDFHEVGDEVMAIFESEAMGHVIYTPSRGVATRTRPIIVGKSNTVSVEDFEEQ